MDYKNEIFYSVLRLFQKGGQMTHSVEHKTDYLEAQKRFYSIIAADLANTEITYHATYIINSTGRIVDAKVFDRRPEKPDVSEVVSNGDNQ